MDASCSNVGPLRLSSRWGEERQAFTSKAGKGKKGKKGKQTEESAASPKTEIHILGGSGIDEVLFMEACWKENLATPWTANP